MAARPQGEEMERLTAEYTAGNCCMPPVLTPLLLLLASLHAAAEAAPNVGADEEDMAAIEQGEIVR